VSAGSSQASALTCTTTSGGENGRAPGPGFSLQASESFLEEAFAPLANDLARDRQTGSNLIIALAVSGQQDHSSSKDGIVWRRISSGLAFQLRPFGIAELDGIRTIAWHILAHLSENIFAEGRTTYNNNTSYYLHPVVLSAIISQSYEINLGYVL
jgi:hypothetical protein